MDFKTNLSNWISAYFSRNYPNVYVYTESHPNINILQTIINGHDITIGVRNRMNNADIIIVDEDEGVYAENIYTYYDLEYVKEDLVRVIPNIINRRK